MSRTSQRKRRQIKKEKRWWRNSMRCTECPRRAHCADICAAGVCRRCHYQKTGQIAFVECKNFPERCAVRPALKDVHGRGYDAKVP